MFLGHFGVGFGAKAAAPRASLGALFLAAQFIDLMWPTLLLIGLGPFLWLVHERVQLGRTLHELAGPTLRIGVASVLGSLWWIASWRLSNSSTMRS